MNEKEKEAKPRIFYFIFNTVSKRVYTIAIITNDGSGVILKCKTKEPRIISFL